MDWTVSCARSGILMEFTQVYPCHRARLFTIKAVVPRLLRPRFTFHPRGGKSTIMQSSNRTNFMAISPLCLRAMRPASARWVNGIGNLAMI